MNPLHPTSYPALNLVLHTLVTEIQDTLEETFLAAYLHGSFAVGDFDEHSDVDFAIVIDQPLTESQVEALQELHDRIYRLDSPWAQHLEGSYFPKDVIKRITYPKIPLWYLDHGSRSLIQSTHCNTNVVRWVVREKGINLAGAPATTFIDPISAQTLREDIYSVMVWWSDEILRDPESINNRFFQTFAVLNYSRMLHDLHTGRIGSKRAGAEWAKATLDPQWHDLIDRAWAGRPHPEISSRQPANPHDLQRTLDFLRSILKAGKQLVTELNVPLVPFY